MCSNIYPTYIYEPISNKNYHTRYMRSCTHLIYAISTITFFYKIFCRYCYTRYNYVPIYKNASVTIS